MSCRSGRQLLLLGLLLLLCCCCCCCYKLCSSWGPRGTLWGLAPAADSSAAGAATRRQQQLSIHPNTHPASCRSSRAADKMLRSLLRLASSSSSSSINKGPVQRAMEHKLREALNPTFMEIVNESAAHKGHADNPSPHLDETHFSLRIRSPKFWGKSLVQQHRLIYEVLKQELSGGVHALSIHSSEPSPEDSHK